MDIRQHPWTQGYGQDRDLGTDSIRTGTVHQNREGSKYRGLVTGTLASITDQDWENRAHGLNTECWVCCLSSWPLVSITEQDICWWAQFPVC